MRWREKQTKIKLNKKKCIYSQLYYNTNVYMFVSIYTRDWLKWEKE